MAGTALKDQVDFISIMVPLEVIAKIINIKFVCACDHLNFASHSALFQAFISFVSAHFDKVHMRLYLHRHVTFCLCTTQ